MPHLFAVNDGVLHSAQGPQGRVTERERFTYVIVACLPSDDSGRPRYRIKCEGESFERVVTEDQLKPLGD
jgi:hypothetical protein